MNDGNYIQTHRYCYNIGRHYATTNDDKLASVYYDIKRLEMLSGGFLGFLGEALQDYINWANSTRFSDFTPVMQAHEKISKTFDAVAANEMTKEEAWELMRDTVPLIMEAAEKALGPREEKEEPEQQEEDDSGYIAPDDTDYTSMEPIDRMNAIIGKMQENWNNNIQWRNIALMKIALATLKEMPDVMENEFNSPAEKANVVMMLTDLTLAHDAPRFSKKAMEYAMELYNKDLDNVLAERIFDDPESQEAKNDAATKEHYNNCINAINIRTDFLDPTLTMAQWEEKYGSAYHHDPVERSEKWEEVTCEVQEKAYYNTRKIMKSDPANHYCFMLLEVAKILREEHGIEWKDIIQMNPTVEEFAYFTFYFNDKPFLTDSKLLYSAYSGFKTLIESDDSSQYSDIVVYICVYLREWANFPDTRSNIDVNRVNILFEKLSNILALRETKEYDRMKTEMLSHLDEIDAIEQNLRKKMRGIE